MSQLEPGSSVRACHSTRLLITSVVVENRPVARRRRPVRRLPVLALRARRPLPGRGRGRLRAPLPSPDRRFRGPPRRRDRRADPRAAREADRHRPGRRPRHHQVAPRAPPLGRGVQGDDLALPEPSRPGGPGAEEEARSRSYIRFAAEMPNETWQSDFTHYRLTRPDGRPERRQRDPDLARRLLPLRPLRDRPPSGSPAPSCWPPSAKPSPNTGSPPRRSPTTGWSSPPGSPGGKGRPQPPRDRTAPSQHRPEERATEPPHHPGQGRAVPADD